MIGDLVRAFYQDVWMSGDVACADRVLHPDLRFRGSIGLEKRGRDGFWEYFELIRGAFAEYRCDILSLVEDGDDAAAKMRFSGIHRRPFMDVQPTRSWVTWQGTAFFRMKDDMLHDIWVLGDVDGLRASLAGAPAPHQVTVFWSMQSPYCWFLNDRLQEMAVRPEIEVTIKPVRPGVIRLPDIYRDRSAVEMAYFDADAERTAAFLDLGFATPDPQPVAFKDDRWVAAPDQPLLDRLYGLFAAACADGQALEFIDIVMRLIWDGRTTGWDMQLDEAVRHMDLKPIDPGPMLQANEAEMYAAGHWGVPLMVYRDEAFYGQDRFDQLLWRIQENE